MTKIAVQMICIRLCAHYSQLPHAKPIIFIFDGDELKAFLCIADSSIPTACVNSAVFFCTVNRAKIVGDDFKNSATSLPGDLA